MIPKAVTVVGLVVTGLVVCACVASPVAPAPALSGQQLAEQKCAGCHAIAFDDASANPDAPALRSLYRRYPVDALHESFTRGMEIGHRGMPRFTLSPAETGSLLAYLRSLDPCGRPASDAAAMARCFEPLGQ